MASETPLPTKTDSVSASISIGIGLFVFGVACSLGARLGGLAPIVAGPFHIHFGHLSAWLIPLVLTAWLAQRAQWQMCLFVVLYGVLLGELLWPVISVWSSGGLFVTREIVFWFLFAVAVAGFSLVVCGRSHPQASQSSNVAKSTCWVFCTGLLASVVTCRLFHYVMLSLGVPNASRSILLTGVEIHHAYVGLTGLYICGLIAFNGCQWVPGALLVGIIAVCCGLIADQALYFCLREITDSAYSGRISWTGALLFVPFYGLWYCLLGQLKLFNSLRSDHTPH